MEHNEAAGSESLSTIQKATPARNVDVVGQILENAHADWYSLPKWIRDRYDSGEIIFADREIHVRKEPGSREWYALSLDQFLGEDENGAIDVSSARLLVPPPVNVHWRESITRHRITEEQLRRVDRVFAYHPPKGDQAERYEKLRGLGRELALAILSLTPESREQSSAMTKLEEAIMHANAAIARNE